MFPLVSLPDPGSPPNTHSLSLQDEQSDGTGGFQYVQRGRAAGRVPWGGRGGRLQAAAAHHPRLAGLRRGCEGTRRRSWAGPRPQRETGSSWKLGDGTAGARAASTNSLFPPQSPAGGSRETLVSEWDWRSFLGGLAASPWSRGR